MRAQKLSHEHVLMVCSGKDCKKNGCKSLCQHLREEIRANGLKSVVRLQRSRCMGCCSRGPNVMAYPSATLYRDVESSDVPRIIEELATA